MSQTELYLDKSESSNENSDSSEGKDRNVEALAESKPHSSSDRGGVSVGFKDPGQLCGLIMPSAARKTAFMALVQRMYTPGAGTIEMDDADIARFSTTSFRDDIAIVP
ncbi:putative leptomycin B resistance protein pmd1 [Colletotrichum sublineola]|uniref:Putative leptomycin B resistance protein pmd1 n=1 Tax=Colletotrichum sublineola TaxID=1173701 RepID=A0A066X7K0_COLSU|nr:putative leptomycin B resistance protein pmd1 [Colletotrichum sublineola]